MDMKLNSTITELIPSINVGRFISSRLYCLLGNVAAKNPKSFGWFFAASLHETSSQKQSFPRRLLSDMHTRSTMNILILISDVQVRWILYCARKVKIIERNEIHHYTCFVIDAHECFDMYNYFVVMSYIYNNNDTYSTHYVPCHLSHWSSW